MIKNLYVAVGYKKVFLYFGSADVAKRLIGSDSSCCCDRASPGITKKTGAKPVSKRKS